MRTSNYTVGCSKVRPVNRDCLQQGKNTGSTCCIRHFRQTKTNRRATSVLLLLPFPTIQVVFSSQKSARAASFPRLNGETLRVLKYSRENSTPVALFAFIWR